jgi:hypothetical protein
MAKKNAQLSTHQEVLWERSKQLHQGGKCKTLSFSSPCNVRELSAGQRGKIDYNKEADGKITSITLILTLNPELVKLRKGSSLL